MKVQGDSPLQDGYQQDHSNSGLLWPGNVSWKDLSKSFELQDNPYLDSDDPWLDILAAASFAVHSMYHTTLCVLPGQLIFWEDMTLNTQYLADWTVIKACKQQLICKNNIIENSKHITHQYKVGDKVMLENHHANKYEQPYKARSLPCYAS